MTRRRPKPDPYLPEQPCAGRRARGEHRRCRVRRDALGDGRHLVTCDTCRAFIRWEN